LILPKRLYRCFKEKIMNGSSFQFATPIFDFSEAKEINRQTLQSNQYVRHWYDGTYRQQECGGDSNAAYDWIFYADGGNLYADWVRDRQHVFFWRNAEGGWQLFDNVHSDSNIDAMQNSQREEYFYRQLGGAFPHHYQALQQHWNQLVMSALTTPLGTKKINGVYYVPEPCEQKIRFYLEDDGLYCDVIGEIQLKQPGSTTTVKMPGQIRSVARLGSYGFEILYYQATNDFLTNLITNESGDSIDKQALQQAEQQEQLRQQQLSYTQAVKDLQTTIQQFGTTQLTAKAQGVLDAVQRAKPSVVEQDVPTLTNIIEATNKAIRQPDCVQDYGRLTQATLSEKHKALRVIGGAMLGFLGVLSIVAGAVLTATGFGAPIGLPVMGAGIALTGAVVTGAGIGMVSISSAILQGPIKDVGKTAQAFHCAWQQEVDIEPEPPAASLS
jgi:hypothetical protein